MQTIPKAIYNCKREPSKTTQVHWPRPPLTLEQNSSQARSLLQRLYFLADGGGQLILLLSWCASQEAEAQPLGAFRTLIHVIM